MCNTWNSIKNFPKKYIQMLKELLDRVLEVINDDDFRKKTKEEARHAFLYLILSAVGAIVDCISFIILTSLGLNIIPSNIISGICGMFTSFSLNLKKNFNMNDHIRMRFISYFTISLIGTAISTSMVYFFIEIIGIPNAIAKFMQIMIMSIPLYLANRSLTFKDSLKKDESSKKHRIFRTLKH